jgi:hypothetical protein
VLIAMTAIHESSGLASREPTASSSHPDSSKLIRPTRVDFLQIGARRWASDREKSRTRKSEIREAIQGPFGWFCRQFLPQEFDACVFQKFVALSRASRLDARGTYRDRHDT